MLLQEFDLTITDKKGVEIVVANHLSRLTSEFCTDITPINDSFPDEFLFSIFLMPWYANIVNFLVTGKMPLQWNTQEKKNFLVEVKKFYWEDPYLFKYCPDQNFRGCIPDIEVSSVINFVILKHVVDNFLQEKLQLKFCNVDFMGLPYSKIHMNFAKLVKTIKN